MKETALLPIISARIKMHVPEIQLHQESHNAPLFLFYKKIPGEPLKTETYLALSESEKKKLAKKLAQFYLQLHCLNPEELQAAGVSAIHPWQQPNEIDANKLLILNNELREVYYKIIEDYNVLSPDPYDTTFGFFSEVGKHMAFDHSKKVLHGIYNFSDSGFAPLHQEFIYTNFTHPELTEYVIQAYETLSGRSIDRQRVATLTSYSYLSQISEALEASEEQAKIVSCFKLWLEISKVFPYDAFQKI
ncbi:MAG: phosphotransferase [Saezia sp.]